jgi:hypothetical protein
MRKYLFFVPIFILIIIFLFVYFYVLPKKFETSPGVSLNISGLKEIKAGDKVTWIVAIKNTHESPIKILSLYFQYPLGTFDKNGNLKRREEININKILGPNETFEKTFEGSIFGKTGEIKEASASVSYQLQGFSSIYQKKVIFQSLLSSSLLSLWFEMPTSIAPETPFSLNVFYKSDFSFPLENLTLSLILPKEFQRTSPIFENEKKEGGNSVFKLGNLNSGEGGKISIEGYFKKQLEDRVLFKASLGKFDEKSYETILLAENEQYLSVKEPLLNLEVKINGKPSPYIASPQEKLNFKISFQNMGNEILKDLKLEVEISQDALELNSLKAFGGEIQGKKIVFLGSSIPSLAYLGPYDKGDVGFEARVKENPGIQRKIVGKVTLGKNVKDFEVKIASSVEGRAFLYFNLPTEIQGIFLPPKGSFPPNINETFESVLILYLKNQGNILQDAKFKVYLGQGVNPIIDERFPKDLKVEFDKEGNILTLSPGSINANFEGKLGIKLELTPKESFQEVISKIEFEAKDSFTDEIVSFSLPSLTLSQVR